MTVEGYLTRYVPNKPDLKTNNLFIARTQIRDIFCRFRKGKILFLIATACWIIFTQPIGHIHPPVVSCKYWNGTNYLLKLPNTNLNNNDDR